MPTSDFEPFFEMSPDLLCILDEGGRFVRANASFSRVLGWKTAALDGKDFLSLVHPNDVTAPGAGFHVDTNADNSNLVPFFEGDVIDANLRLRLETNNRVVFANYGGPSGGLPSGE